MGCGDWRRCGLIRREPENEKDSYTYLSMVVEPADGERKVTEAGFEK